MDASLVWDPPNARADLVVFGAGLLTGNDLETAVLISLFTDHEADPGDILPRTEFDRRGWWADRYETPDKIGSKLWQAFWRQRVPDTLNWARDTAQQSLQWMVEDGVASAVAVVPSFYGSGGLALHIAVTQPPGVSVFRYAWDQLGIVALH
jgi:phage gp46-like protein